MTTVSVVQNNFNGGELSPSLIGGFDLEKYQTCIKKGLNAIVTETREIMNRPGLEFICEVEDSLNSVRLLPFRFNSEQSYIIEAGENYFRFLQNGGLITYPPNYGNALFTGAINFVEHIGVQNYIESKNFKPVRYDDNVQKVGGIWYFAGRFEGDIIFQEAFPTPPFSVSCTIGGEKAEVTQITSEGFHYRLPFAAKLVYQIADLNGFYNAISSNGDNFSWKYQLENGTVLYSSEEIQIGTKLYTDSYKQKLYGVVSSLNGNNIIIGNDDAKRKLQNQIVKIPTPFKGVDLAKLKFTQNADIVTLCCKGYYPVELSRNGYYEWSLNNVLTQADIEAPKGLTGNWTGGNENPRTYKYKVTAINKNFEESPASSACGVLGEYEASWGVGEKINLSWNTVAGAISYNVYRCVNGIYGFIGSSDSTNFSDEKIEPDMSTTPPIPQSPFMENENGYPESVAYYQQRRIFANFPNFPQRFITSQVGAYSNFNISRPVIASDSMTVDLCENEINEIKHIIPLEDLIIMTSGAEWRVKGSDGAFNATPAPVCSPQTYWGSCDISPIVSGNMILFVTTTRDSVRDLGYTVLSDSYDGDCLTTFASHIFENNKIKEWAYVKSPKPYIIAILENGKGAVLTYNRKQNVCGWTEIETDGFFESVAVSRENGIDIPYFVVKRIINGQPKKYIERMKPRIFEKTEEAFFVDSGLSRTFAYPVNVVSGLNHLEGKNVVAVCDGGVVENLAVNNGAVILPNPVKKITIGLPYKFLVELLPIDTQATVGKLKKITEVSFKIRNSREDFFVQTGKLKKQIPRSSEGIKDANLLFSGSVKTNLFGEGQTETDLSFEQSLPLPLCISAITQTVTVG